MSVPTKTGNQWLKEYREINSKSELGLFLSKRWVLLEDHQKEKKEIVKDIISFSVTTNSKTELQCKIINMFNALFDAQSPKTRDHILVDKDKPSQTSSHSGESEPVGVSSPCQNCGHEKDNHIKKGFYFDDCINCSCSGFVEKTK